MSESNSKLLVLVPVFNDWSVVPLMLDKLDAELAKDNRQANVILVDDGSVQLAPRTWPPLSHGAIRKIDIVALRRNLGHQRALALGMTYIQANVPADAIVVMDGDGEDDPADVPRLLKAFEEHNAEEFIFAQRTRRSENLRFRVFYRLYCIFHYILTGIPVRVGNFSVIPRASLDNLVVVSDLWNHYAASVHKARFRYSTIPTHRATRLAGVTRMNFVGLAIHGLSALSIYGDLIGVRIIIALMLMLILDTVALFTLAIMRTLDIGHVPYIALAVLAGALAMFLIMLMATSLFVFLVLGARDNTRFLPARDYAYFIKETRTVFPGPAHG